MRQFASSASALNTGVKSFTEQFGYGDFTDGGSTSGTKQMTGEIPVGALFLGSVVKVPAGFAGDTTATLQIGDGSDTDRYNGPATAASTLGPLVRIAETVAYDDFTDGGSTVGTFALSTQIPIGATVLASAVSAVTGFAGDTSAALTIGDGTDVDRYNTSTIDCFTTAAGGVDAGAVSGVAYHAAAKTVTLTMTTASDFTSVSAGSVTVEIYYLDTAVDTAAVMPSVFATDANGIDMGVPSGVLFHQTAVKPTLTITTSSDWGSVTAGTVNVTMFYI